MKSNGPAPDNTVRAAWESFKQAFIAHDAPAVQVVEMKRAFYGGCGMMLLMCQAIGEDAVSKEQGVALLQSWTAEFEQFLALLKMGRA